MSEPTSVAFVVPQVGDDVSEHFAHLPALVEEVGGFLSTSVLAGAGDAAARLDGAGPVLVQRQVAPAARTAEFVRLWLRLRSTGTRIFFIRSSAGSAVLSGVLGRLFGATTVFWTSGESKVLDWLYPPRNFRERVARAARSTRFEFALRAADVVATGPSSMGPYYERWHRVPSTKLVFLDNDIDLTRFRPRMGLSTTGPYRVLYLHRVSAGRGAGVLPRLADDLRGRWPGSTVVVAGEGPMRGELQHLAGRGLEILGPVPNRDVPELLRSCDLLVVPSLAGEGFPRVLLEAMASSVPFVATDVGGVREVVGEELGRLLVSRGDEDAFIHAVMELLASPEQRQRLVDHGLTRVRGFATPVVARQYVELFRRLDPSVMADAG